MNGLHTLALAFLLVPATGVSAQEAPKPRPTSVYKVDLTIHTVEGGKRISSRGYMLLLESGAKGTHRMGQRVPIPLGGASPSATPQYQYHDIGVSIDCTVREHNDALLLDASVDVSDLDLPDAKSPTGPAPTIKNARMNVSRTVLIPGQKTIVSAADNPNGRQRYEIEVQATPVR